ncbi:hypothetical protein VPNG_06785 [Cytospora leucostoma]|uniref:Uncharacterized protein n=1 Tax=Cytospora leucostoma TaxID=1230097 RepID=A0A423WVR7_9PEZI|nr:hypothetical protein VPNG_06785 [Cytospora leucostoma]
MSELRRTPSVKVQTDVVVPQRLLSVSRRAGDDWPLRSNSLRVRHLERQATHTTQNSPGVGPSQQPSQKDDTDVYQKKRRSFIPPADAGKRTSWQGIQAVGRPRKTSDPITLQDRRSALQSIYLEKGTERDLEAGIVPGSGGVDDPFSDEHAARLSRYRFPLVGTNTTNSLSTTTTSTESSSGNEEPLVNHPTSSEGVPRRNGTVRRVVDAVVPEKVQETARNVINKAGNNTAMHEVYEKAKIRGVELQRKRWVEILFEYTFYTVLICFIYFVLIGLPLWKGAVYWLYWVVGHKFVIAGGWSITIGIAVFYAFGPLFLLFEKEPPIVDHPEGFDRNSLPGVADTALLIPCYKAANIVGATLEAAVKIFPPSHIFVIANGNSETPLDNTEDVCLPYGVNHIWSPVGSKIVAQFVGSYAAKGFKNVLLIDDDCALPPNFPVVSDRLTDTVKSIGYTIKSVGPNSSKGTWCQQAQDLEYKISGLQRALAGKMGSATFPHGAISLWERDFLIKTFHDHPGFSVSEDWFFGHSCRRLGGRIKMCTSVFVETETPPAVFFSSGGSRGGFGEMTVFKQRFSRWNFFFVNGMYYNMHYILTSWKLGWWEIGAKLFVFQEVYETLLYLFTPFILPISFVVSPAFCGYLLAGTAVLYLANVIVFNELQLRLRNERIGWDVLLFYYMPYKIVLTAVNVASCYWSLYKYARYFAKRHPKVIEDEKAVEVVLMLEETTPVRAREAGSGPGAGLKRQMSIAVPEAGGATKRLSARISYSSVHSDVLGNLNKRRSFIPGTDDIISINSSPTSSVFGRTGMPEPVGSTPDNRLSYGEPWPTLDEASREYSSSSDSPSSDDEDGRPESQVIQISVQPPQSAYIPIDKTNSAEEEVLDEKRTSGSVFGDPKKDSWSQSMV